MKRFIIVVIFSLALISTAAAQSMTGKTMYVTAKTVDLKSSTAFFSDVKGTLEYGDQVTVLQEYGRWAEVRAVEKQNLSGWVATANLTSKRLLSGGSGTTSASANELALAGKGFNQEVENSYKANGNLNYDAIDAIEKEEVPNRELYNFLLEGHLARGEE
jgi:uncharacterized protein YgiM (DUF1202 family)